MTTEKVVKLNGKDYTFAYDWDAQEKAEKILDQNLLAPSGTGSEILRIVAFARLLKFHPDITMDEVKSILPGNVPAIADALLAIGDFQEPGPIEPTSEPAKSSEVS